MAPPGRSGEQIKEGGGEARRVLVVDDNAANRLAFRCILEHLGVAVDVAASGLEALELAARHPFDAIVVDVRMPIMDGIETAQRLRTLDRNAATPLIFTSAHEVDRQSVADIHSIGGVVLFSPVDSDELVEVTRRALRAPA